MDIVFRDFTDTLTWGSTCMHVHMLATLRQSRDGHSVLGLYRYSGPHRLPS